MNEPKHTVAELSEKFETMFGIPIEQGIERVKLLMRRTISMGEATSGMNWNGFFGLSVRSCSRTTIEDHDFMMFAFFAMYGLGQFEALPKVELRATPPAALLQKP
jgi:hypothetical protein